MKKILSVLLALAVVFSLTACGTDDGSTTAPSDGVPTAQYANTKWDGKSLKVLCVGNSFARNATKVLYQIAEAHGVEEIVLGVLHIGGCTVETHWENAQSGEAAYKYYKNTTGTWELTEDVTMLQGLTDEAWDVITITQGKGLYGVADSYDGCLKELVAYLRSNMTNQEAQIAFHMTWAFPPDSTTGRFAYYGHDQAVMFRRIAETARDVILPMEGIDFLLPSGTGIQNARTKLGEIFCKDDGYHLNSVGEYVAGYVWFAYLTGQPIDGLKYMDSIVEPVKAMHQPIVDAVNAALQKPFEVTDVSN